MINFFRNRKKKKFLNRLKYGQDKKQLYSTETLSDALAVGDEEKAIEILSVLVQRKVKENNATSS